MKYIKKKSKDKVIQFYRGIGCISIISYHFLYRYGEIYNLNNSSISVLSSLGVIGVALFLVLTGYFGVSSKDISVKDQLKKKVISLYPAYFLAVTLSFLISRLGYLGEERIVGFKDYLLNITLINGFISKPYVDGAHWYITYILVFSICFSYLNKKKVSNKPMLYLLWLSINAVIFFANRIFIGDSFPSLGKLLYILVGNKYLGFIVVGVCIRYIERTKDKKEKNKWILVLISALIFVLIFYRSISVFIFGIIFSFILYMRSYFSILSRFTGVVWIGDISYGIYLIHQNIGYSIMNYLRIEFNIESIFILFFVAFIVAILLGLLIMLASKNLLKIFKVNE
ncbi:MAG: acyltransferase [Clostridium sp.]|nr:acyltransferase [Clostridium sp.]